MTLDERNDFLKSLNADDFLQLGEEDVAYVREIEWLGNTHFAIHSATGEALAIAPNRETALIALQSQDREPVTLH
jgi:hypothetical protein